MQLPHKPWSIMLFVFFLVFALYQLSAGYFHFHSFLQRPIHVAFGLVACFLLYTGTGKRLKGKIEIWDICLIALSVICTGYVVANYAHAVENPCGLATHELAFGLILLLLALEATRRSMGIVLPILVVLAIFYALAGPIFPGHFRFAGILPRTLIESLYFGAEGFWGFFVGLSNNVIALFIIMAPLLQQSGATKTFQCLALRVAGLTTGGAAKAAVVMSAAFGTISGSSVANVAGTGILTIPMMKKFGYPPAFAGGVEASASAGGQLMPPIMGAAAFVMAEILGISYLRICLAALVPALIYFFAVGVGIHFEAKKRNLSPVSRELIIPLRKCLEFSKLAPLVVSITLLLWAIIEGYSLGFAALTAILSCAVLYTVLGGDFSLRGIWDRTKLVAEALRRGTENLAPLVAMIVCIQIIVIVLNLSGLGIKLSDIVMSLAGVNLFLALALAMVVAMVLGMGLPTTAAYVIGVSVVAPVLINIGLAPLTAHLFVFYFAVLAVVTPPVCAAVFVAAPIAGVPWLRVALNAVKLVLPCYLLPYLFAIKPTLFLNGVWYQIIFDVASTMLGTLALAAGVMGYFAQKTNLVERGLLILSGFSLIVVTDLNWQITILALILAVFLRNTSTFHRLIKRLKLTFR